MRVPLTVTDFLERAEQVYGQRVAIVDEPDQPAPSLGTLSYRQMSELAAGQAAGLDALGVEVGERVAIVSHNAARLFVSFYGVSGWGRILVPINFRLNADEIGITLSEEDQLDPEQSTSAIVLYHPQAKYFSV